MSKEGPVENSNKSESGDDALAQHMKGCSLSELKRLAVQGETDLTQFRARQELSRRAKLGAKKRALKKAEEDAYNELVGEVNEHFENTKREEFIEQEISRLKSIYDFGTDEEGQSVKGFTEEEKNRRIRKSAEKYADVMLRMQKRMTKQ